MIGNSFTEEDLSMVQELIQYPIATAYKTFKPEEMWIEEV